MTAPHAPLLSLFPLPLFRAEIRVLEEPPNRAHRDAAPPDEVFAIAQVIYFDAGAQISNIVEQEVRVAVHVNMLQPIERLQACVEAHRRVLDELFTRRLAADDDWLALPCELLFIDELLALRNAGAVEQFEQALRAKKRLGKLFR